MGGKILLISINQQKFVHPVPPIGALYLASILRERGHEVQFVDLMFERNTDDAIRRGFAGFQPDIIGISIRNIDSLISKTEFSLPALESCIQSVRRHSSAPIVLGGAGFTLFAQPILAATGMDLGIVGEADEAFPLLVANILQGKSYESLPGLCYRRNGGFISNPPQQVTDLDTIPSQAIDLIDAKRYNRNRGAMGVITRKACPLNCVYCPEAAVHGNAVRLRSPEKVASEIEHIIRTSGVRYFDFADTTFNVPRRHALAVCNEIVRRRLDFQFEVELSPNGQDDESVQMLRKTGCKGVDLTVDSGSNRMLKVLKKGFTKEQALEVARLYRRHGIPYTAGFLFGGPGENRESVEETIAFARSLPDPNVVYFTVGIRIFPQTELFTDLGARDPELARDSLLVPKFYVSDEFDDGCAESLLEACRKHANFYISDIFYKPVMKCVVEGAALFNVRPAWKVGSFPHLFQKVVQFGADGLSWDSRTRAFV